MYSWLQLLISVIILQEVYEKMLAGGKDWDEELYQRWKRDGYQIKLAGKL